MENNGLITVKGKEVERHSVTGYGRQDINYNDPEGEFVYYEDYTALQQQLTATTNILKSAGIEADTVQAGVMELKDKLTLVREQRDSELNLNTELEAKLAELEQKKILLEQGCENNPLLHEMLDWKERAEAAELKLSNHNAVRAKGMEDAINILKALDASPFAIYALERRLYELRAGNAGKDGSHE